MKADASESSQNTYLFCACSKELLSAARRVTGLDLPPPSKKTVEQLFKAADRDHSGDLSQVTPERHDITLMWSLTCRQYSLGEVWMGPVDTAAPAAGAVHGACSEP